MCFLLYLCVINDVYMTYQQTIDYLYSSQPAFHLVGAKAYKPGLENTWRLMEHLGNPHEQLRSVHVPTEKVLPRILLLRCCRRKAIRWGCLLRLTWLIFVNVFVSRAR